MMSWSDLAAGTLARQFPAEVEPGDVAGLLAAVGPIQSQTARSVFIGMAARLPGVTRAQLSAAYESSAIVRGSTLRGTVHTSSAALHPLLEVATRLGQRALWSRTLKPSETTLEQIWASIEDFARNGWRTPAELAEHLLGWLAAHDPAAAPAFAGTSGRYFAFGHGGLLRRPVQGDWSGQGAPEYRTAAAVLGDDNRRTAALAAPDEALDALFRHQLAAAGPLSRHDLAWWSGLGLTRVDAALARLDLSAEPGPDGRLYHDLPDAPPPARLAGVHLLPEFDALFCAFDPAGRRRFVDPAHYQVLWKQQNGMLLAPVLLDERLRGHWRMQGSGRTRSVEVTLFAGTRDLEDHELVAPLVALELALGVSVAEVRLNHEV
ncbi:MAG: AlkZ family DNA glycosylase [Micropruina sp.]|nr:AlkZ family DNA glycosylase [Micropruina sp.]